MVCLPWAVGVAEPLCMPGQAHWEVCLDSRRRESRQSTFPDFLTELGRFYLRGLVTSKQCGVEGIVVNLGASGAGGTRGIDS